MGDSRCSLGFLPERRNHTGHFHIHCPMQHGTTSALSQAWPRKGTREWLLRPGSRGAPPWPRKFYASSKTVLLNATSTRAQQSSESTALPVQWTRARSGRGSLVSSHFIDEETEAQDGYTAARESNKSGLVSPSSPASLCSPGHRCLRQAWTCSRPYHLA